MSLSAWFFLIATWGGIIVLTLYCFIKMLKEPPPPPDEVHEHELLPPTA